MRIGSGSGTEVTSILCNERSEEMMDLTFGFRKLLYLPGLSCVTHEGALLVVTANQWLSS